MNIAIYNIADSKLNKYYVFQCNTGEKTSSMHIELKNTIPSTNTWDVSL